MPQLTPTQYIDRLAQEAGITRPVVIRVLASMSGMTRGQTAAVIQAAMVEIEEQDPFTSLENPIEVVTLGGRRHYVEGGSQAFAPTPHMIDITPPEEK